MDKGSGPLPSPMGYRSGRALATLSRRPYPENGYEWEVGSPMPMLNPLGNSASFPNKGWLEPAARLDPSNTQKTTTLKLRSSQKMRTPNHIGPSCTFWGNPATSNPAGLTSFGCDLARAPATWQAKQGHQRFDLLWCALKLDWKKSTSQWTDKTFNLWPGKPPMARLTLGNDEAPPSQVPVKFVTDISPPTNWLVWIKKVLSDLEPMGRLVDPGTVVNKTNLEDRLGKLRN